jgi:arsenate reductase
MKMKSSELLRKNDEAYKQLKTKIGKISEEEILNLMIKNPDLVQRPTVEKGDRAILARPPERIIELL